MVAINRCSRCRTDLGTSASYCPRCGLRLDDGQTPGMARHPNPLAAPTGFRGVHGAADLHWRWRPAWGERMLLGTEPVILAVFNAGYGLVHVDLRVIALDKRGRDVGSHVTSIPELLQGQTNEIELASHDLQAPLSDLSVELERAEFAPE